MGAVFNLALIKPLHNGIALGALDKGSAVRFIEAVGSLFLDVLQSVRLSGAADTACLAGHDLHQVEVCGAILNPLQQLLCVDKSVNNGNLQLPVAHGQRYGADRFRASQPGKRQRLLRVFGFILQAASRNRFGHAAGRSENSSCTCTDPEGQIRGLTFDFRKANAGFVDHIDELLSRQNQVHIRLSVVLEFFALSFHFFCRAGHDGNVVDLPAILCILAFVLILQHGCEHLHG
ncbi:hypothetical protein SDC9_143887 [bioreactor metagenome]|uniref:Uncharacterized protein n=1 Tax=bioreactor metagenome TaxID=1076179 RepID=A0A645E7X2_9ZZZZ